MGITILAVGGVAGLVSGIIMFILGYIGKDTHSMLLGLFLLGLGLFNWISYQGVKTRHHMDKTVEEIKQNIDEAITFSRP